MSLTSQTVSPSIYLIADHLDAMLAHGEDLRGTSAPVSPGPARDSQQMQHRLNDQRAFLETVRTLEMRLVTRVLRAREHAEQVRRADGRFKAITDLFVTGTHVVADAAADLADSTALDFNTGRDSIAYLRSRGLIDNQATVLPRGAGFKITEGFRLVGTIELGALLDLAAAYIDALELHYELYGENAGAGRASAAKSAAVAESEAPANA